MAYCTQSDMEQRIGLSQLAALTNDVWQVSAPGSVTATPKAGGSLAVNTYYYVVTAVSAKGETIASSEVNATTDGTNKTITLAWTAVSGAQAYRVYRSTVSGTYATPCLLALSTAVTVDDDGTDALSAGAPSANAYLPNDGVITNLIARADALIDSYCGQVYSVPFTTTPSIINRLSIDLACFFALQRRPMGVAVPKDWQKVYDDSVKQLDSISNMLLKLDQSPTVASAEADMVTPTTDPVVSFTSIDNPMSDY